MKQGGESNAYSILYLWAGGGGGGWGGVPLTEGSSSSI
jgi:hypothetical protein